MKSFILICLLVLSACQQNSQSLKEPVTDSNQNGIIGGDELKANHELSSYIVGLYNEQDSTICTATFIANGVLLTAAHCVPKLPQALRIIFDQELTQESPSLFAQKIVVHPLYNKERYEDMHDLALVFIEETPASFRSMVISADFGLLQKKTRVIAAGFGLNWAWGFKRGSGVLRATELKIEAPFFSQTEMLIDQSLRRGICSGDSGGPIIVNIGGKFILVGVASRSDSLRIPLTPDCFISAVATRVDVFADWIQSVISKN